MSLFNRALRPPLVMSDEAVERCLVALRSQVQPDPLFRRRLRSDVVNRFVAAREGIEVPAPASQVRHMGQLGRACLYASCAFALSAASVLAASQEALPGELLYPLKQRIEQVRIDVLPSHLHPELTAYALGERIEEMGRLADAGRLDLAATMAPEIDREYERLGMLGATAGDAGAARIERHMLVLDRLIATLPDSARAVVERAMSGTPPTRPTPTVHGRSKSQTQGAADPVRGGTGSSATHGTDPSPETSAAAASTAKPERTPKPEPTHRPEPTRRPVSSPAQGPNAPQVPAESSSSR